MTFDQWQKAWSDYRNQEQEAFKSKYGYTPTFSMAGPPKAQPGSEQKTPTPITAPSTTAPITTTAITPAAVTPPGTSELNKNLLVTPPAATAGQNALTALQMLLGRAATGGLGTYRFPDLVKQTQQRWGGFSPAAFSKP